jgi:hypothetical protein
MTEKVTLCTSSVVTKNGLHQTEWKCTLQSKEQITNVVFVILYA